MELLTDFHVHSRYAHGTSKFSTLEGLYEWGKLKGINIIGTGDFTHPTWFAELQDKLVPDGHGLYQLRRDIAHEIEMRLPESVRGTLIRFVPTVEIATIYSKGGRVRKIHQLIVMPDLQHAHELIIRLSKIGNLSADGRPIVGMDAKELLRMSLDITPKSLYIPAHIWTPWFGLFGSKSGFDSLAEAYEELTPQVRAIETGLSSDPAMNAHIRSLNGLAITSHSDSHSPQKLGREATVLNCKPEYNDIINAFKTNDARLTGTIEFFPQEGKYFGDGHRKCGVHFTPAETKAHQGICPVCHRPLTVGVNYRVDELAETKAYKSGKRAEYIVPLAEILAELHGVKSTSSKAVQKQLMGMYTALGDEFGILRSVPIDDIQNAGFTETAQAIQALRAKNVTITAGYDGVYGVISVKPTT